jgi:hypothetical protein
MTGTRSERVEGLAPHRCSVVATTATRRVWPIQGTDREEVTLTCDSCQMRRSTYERRRPTGRG